ncbi:helix-turn-helix domain-containing protein [Thermodesulfobacteriota bacterium]
MVKEKNFADQVKSVRKQLGISQEELARKLGVSFATVNRWENGRTNPIMLAKTQFDEFCKKMTGQGRLRIHKEK